ncbi:MAG: hypothetical protein SVC26_07855, partial [Pseudomonadota bacterium]|nr:hypothetical protein [Pseudomonadota bacterium]
FDDLAAYTTFAKHWSELYGFALILQFSPYSPFAHPSVSYESMMGYIGEKPLLPNGSQDQIDLIELYIDDLVAARDILEETYNFDSTVVESW